MKGFPARYLAILSVGLTLGSHAVPAAGAAGAEIPSREAEGGLAGLLVSAPLLSGHFAQEKRIAGLKKPLLSQGDFLVARDKGVIWRTRKPFAAAIAVTPKGIWSLREEGGTVKRSPIHQGNLGAAMDMIQKVLAGDPSSLAKSFRVTEGGNARAWTLDLKPLDPVVARIITDIRLRGSRHADGVEYSEANGDKTRIAFTEVAGNAGELASWQAAAFRE